MPAFTMQVSAYLDNGCCIIPESAEIVRHTCPLQLWMNLRFRSACSIFSIYHDCSASCLSHLLHLSTIHATHTSAAVSKGRQTKLSIVLKKA